MAIPGCRRLQAKVTADAQCRSRGVGYGRAGHGQEFRWPREVVGHVLQKLSVKPITQPGGARAGGASGLLVRRVKWRN